MDSRGPSSDRTRVPHATEHPLDDIEMMGVSGLPRDDSPPWSIHHLRVANAGLGQAPCPENGCEPSSSDGTSVRTPSAVDLGHGLIEATSATGLDLEDVDIDLGHGNVDSLVLGKMDTMGLEAQCGRSYIGAHDPISILKAFGANLREGTLSSCDATPSHYHAQVELTDDGEPAGPLSSHPMVGEPVTAERLRQYPALVRTQHTEYSACCATGTRGCAEVRIGYGGRTARWRKGSELRYNVLIESFPPELSPVVEDAMKEAISWWQGAGASFKQVPCGSQATFALKYEGGKRSKAYACSFFPDTGWAELVVYDKSRSKAEYLPNILAHEIGHILGLRHEFAHLEEWDNPSTLLGSEDDRSIMGYYKHVGRLQVSELDLQGLRQFYDCDQAEYNGFPLVVIEPRLHDFGEADAASHAMRDSAADARSALCPFVFGRFFQRSLLFVRNIFHRLRPYISYWSLMARWRSKAGEILPSPFGWLAPLLNQVQSLFR